jgi:hypothetical protein
VIQVFACWLCRRIASGENNAKQRLVVKAWGVHGAVAADALGQRQHLARLNLKPPLYPEVAVHLCDLPPLDRCSEISPVRLAKLSAPAKSAFKKSRYKAL